MPREFGGDLRPVGPGRPARSARRPRRDRTNVSVRAPSTIRSAITRAASAPAERRTGAPFSPVMSVRSAGSHSATVRAPCGEPSSVTSTTRLPDQLGGRLAGLRWWRWRRSPSAACAGGRVARRQAQQPAQHHRHVGAENASVVMTFVDDDVPQVRAGRPPTGRGCAASTGGSCPGWRRSTASVRGRIAAPRLGCRRRRTSARRRAEPGHRRGQRVRGAQLVVAERLGGRQVERPCARIGGQRRQDRQLVGQRLARGRSGADHDVAPVVREVGGRRPDATTAWSMPRSVKACTTSGSAQCRPASAARPCRGGNSATWRSGCSSALRHRRRAEIAAVEQFAAEVRRHPSTNCSPVGSNEDCRGSPEHDLMKAVAASVWCQQLSQDRRCGRGSCEGCAVGTGPVHRKVVDRTR